MKPWHEDEDFWNNWEAILFRKKIWERTPNEIEHIISLLELKPNDHILDLCCGLGRHSLELARRGFKVTGVDRTNSYLIQAKEYALNENLDIEFILNDMRNFSRLNSFDAIININTSFSYFQDINDDKKVLKNIFTSLKEGGKALIEMIGKEILARKFLRRNWLELDGTFVLYERNVNKDWSWMENRWILIKNQETKEFKVNHRLYSGTELRNLFNEVGFKKIAIYGDLQGSKYNQKAKRLVGIGIK